MLKWPCNRNNIMIHINSCHKRNILSVDHITEHTVIQTRRFEAWGHGIFSVTCYCRGPEYSINSVRCLMVCRKRSRRSVQINPMSVKRESKLNYLSIIFSTVKLTFSSQNLFYKRCFYFQDIFVTLYDDENQTRINCYTLSCH